MKTLESGSVFLQQPPLRGTNSFLLQSEEQHQSIHENREDRTHELPSRTSIISGSHHLSMTTSRRLLQSTELLGPLNTHRSVPLQFRVGSNAHSFFNESARQYKDSCPYMDVRQRWSSLLGYFNVISEFSSRFCLLFPQLAFLPPSNTVSSLPLNFRESVNNLQIIKENKSLKYERLLKNEPNQCTQVPSSCMTQAVGLLLQDTPVTMN